MAKSELPDPPAPNPPTDPAKPSRSGADAAPSDPQAELYPSDVVAEAPGISGSGGAAIVLGALAIVFLVLMVTGWNYSVPYLHPDNNAAGVTVEGDRTTTQYMFVGNGTYAVSNESELCLECPFGTGDGGTFTYRITITNPYSGQFELTGIIAEPPFKVGSYSPTGVLIAGGLSQAVVLQMDAPAVGGTYAMQLYVTGNIG